MEIFNLYLAKTSAEAGSGQGMMMLIVYVVIIGAMMYFMAIRPQKKQQKAMNEMSAALEVGDSILTSSGFYGVVIDINAEIVVVEFGNNKNCRIPMKKAAIAAVEKSDGTTYTLDR